MLENSISYPVLLDKDEELFKSFGVNALPQTVLVDRRGKIRFIHMGFNPKDTPKLETGNHPVAAGEMRQFQCEK